MAGQLAADQADPVPAGRSRARLTQPAAAIVLGLVTAPARLGAELASLPQRLRAVERRVLLLLDQVEVIVGSVQVTAAKAEVVAADADETRRAVGSVVDEARAQVQQAASLLADVSGPAGAARPTLTRAAEVIGPQHVDGTAQLLDLVPELLDLVLPALRGLSELSPGMQQLGERLDNIAHIVEGVPGAGAMKRRGTERIEAE